MDYNEVSKLVHFILRYKDPIDNLHDKQVATLVMKIVDIMQPDLDPATRLIVEAVAHLHDIGKIFLSDSLLNSPRKYTIQEYEASKTHVIMGHKLAHAMGFDKIVHDCILYHHENVDGSGYLSKKRKVDIPFYARIIRIADSYDAMLARRIYKPAMTASPASCRAALRRCTSRRTASGRL